MGLEIKLYVLKKTEDVISERKRKGTEQGGEITEVSTPGDDKAKGRGRGRGGVQP